MLRPQPMGSSSRRPLYSSHTVQCARFICSECNIDNSVKESKSVVLLKWAICGALQLHCKILGNVMGQLCWRGGERGAGDITAAKPQPVQTTFSQTPPVHMLPLQSFTLFYIFHFYKTTNCPSYFFSKTTTCYLRSLFTKLPTAPVLLFTKPPHVKQICLFSQIPFFATL